MSQERGKSSANHVNHRDKEFDSFLDVIERSNTDPHLFLPKRIIGEIDSSDSEFNSTREFEKHLAKVYSKEIKEDSVNFKFDLLSKCGEEIVNNKYRSINFDKAALLLESSAQVYSGKVDRLHSLAFKDLESIHQKGEAEQPQNAWKQSEEDDMEVDPNCTLEDTANLMDVVLQGEGLDAAGDRGQLQSSTDSRIPNISESEKHEEQLDAHVSLWNERIEQHLEELGESRASDVNDYGKRVLQKLSQSADNKNKASFADVVQGETKHDVARSFAALLHLVTDGNVDLQRSDSTDEEFPSEEAISIRLLRHAKRRQDVQYESSKKRAAIGDSSKDKRGSSGKENSEPPAPNDDSPFSDWKTVGDLR